MDILEEPDIIAEHIAELRRKAAAAQQDYDEVRRTDTVLARIDFYTSLANQIESLLVNHHQAMHVAEEEVQLRVVEAQKGALIRMADLVQNRAASLQQWQADRTAARIRREAARVGKK